MAYKMLAAGEKMLKVLLGSGVVLRGGKEKKGSPVYWCPEETNAPFAFICGGSGSGKSVTVRSLVERLGEAGSPCFIIDFHGTDFKGLKYVGEEYLLSVASDEGINPLALDSFNVHGGGPMNQMFLIVELIGRVFRLGEQQKSVLREVIKEAYRMKGIDQDDPESWEKEAPNFGLVKELLSQRIEESRNEKTGVVQDKVAERLLSKLAILFDIGIFSREKNIDISKALEVTIRVDLSYLPDELMVLASDTLLRKVFRLCRMKGDSGGKVRVFIVVDELKVMFKGNAKEILYALSDQARKYGAGLIFATQSMRQVDNQLLTNFPTKICLKIPDIEWNSTIRAIQCSKRDLMYPTHPGEGIISFGKHYQRLKVEAV
jgi:DNA helicase HerA-like ATPase